MVVSSIFLLALLSLMAAGLLLFRYRHRKNEMNRDIETAYRDHRTRKFFQEG
jgi:hypothetical protein